MLQQLLGLQQREGLIYSFYAITSTFLPIAVTSGVLYYGGLLVLEGRLSPGGLVSFMLYQQSLTGAFQQMGDVFQG